MPGPGIISLVKQDVLGKSSNTVYSRDCDSCDNCDRGCEACDVSTCEGGHCDREG